MFFLWTVYTGVLYAISRWFGGSGDFRALFKLVGWGYLPTIFAGIVSLLVTYWAFQGASVSQDPQVMQTQLQQLQRQPIFLVNGVLGVVFLVWQGFIWMFALATRVIWTCVTPPTPFSFRSQ